LEQEIEKIERRMEVRGYTQATDRGSKGEKEQRSKGAKEQVTRRRNKDEMLDGERQG